MADRPEIQHSGSTTRIILRGDKTKRQEPDEVYINFPGGHIGVTRTTDGDYWAHFGIMDERHAVPGLDALGKIIDARIDKVDEHAAADSGAPLLQGNVNHVAIKIARA